MNSISPAVSTKPYFTTPGNHEADDDMFGNYIARFAAQEQGLGADSGSGSNLYYSWNEGPAHFVAIDTEMWAYGATAAQIKAQQAFLEADLAAVDRSVTPWVIGYGHKAGWMDNIGTGWTDVFDPLFAKNVDLYFCGHTHKWVHEARLRQQKQPARLTDAPLTTHKTLYTPPCILSRPAATSARSLPSTTRPWTPSASRAATCTTTAPAPPSSSRAPPAARRSCPQAPRPSPSCSSTSRREYALALRLDRRNTDVIVCTSGAL